LEEYHFDGLRLDAVQEIKDDSPVNILEELAERVRNRVNDRHIHLVLENDDNIPELLERKGDSPRYYDAQWNDDFHHCVHILLTGEKGGYYKDYTEDYSSKSPTVHLAKCLAEGYAFQGEVSAYRDNLPRGGKTTNLRVSSFVNFLQNHDMVGNRAFGERITSLTSKDALKAAVCLYLVAPEIPLLFMGEEWGSKTPFMFFSNLGDELSDSIREGRRREYSRFPEFVDPANREKIPDPTLESTFRGSFPDWDEQDTEILDFYRQMLRIRKKLVIPLISLIEHSKSTFEVIQEGCFRAKWFVSNSKTLEVTANLSCNEVLLDIEFDKNVIAKSTGREEKGKLAVWSVYWHLR
jgi:maltooligosyltrehalose trehalohydrolase